MRLASVSASMSLSLSVVLLLSVSAAVYEELNINSPLTQEIMRQAKAAGMRSYMNAEWQPCDDFYEYACGNFGRINPATDRRTSTHLFRHLDAGFQRRVLQLLKQPKISTDSPTETRVKYFFESCLDTEAIKLKQRPFLINLLNEFGGMPAHKRSAWNESGFDALQLMADLLKRFGKVTLLNAMVMPGLSNSQENRLYLGQRDDLPGQDVYGPHASIQLKLEQNMHQLLGISSKRAKEKTQEIMDLNLELARKSPNAKYVRLKMLNDMSDKYAPTLNLTEFVRLWLGYDYKLPVYEYSEAYLWQLKELLAETPSRVLANYMLSSLLGDFDIQPAETQAKQEELCAQRTGVLFADFINHLVYRSLEKQNPDIPGSFRQLWQELKESFAHMLRSNSDKWLDEQTQNEALAKLKSMTFHILGADAEGLEQAYSTLIIATDDYFGNVQRLLELRARQLREELLGAVNYHKYDGLSKSPFYVPEFNRVLIPTSCMQHRFFFGEAYPLALKYATVGFLLAHELAHGFDDVSRIYDAQGNHRDWWQPSAAHQFEERKQCFVSQFAAFRYVDAKLPQQQQQAENIADNVGVRIAYGAYLSRLQQLPAAAETLPQMPHTATQLFFLALAQTMCSDSLPELRYSLAKTDEHAPDELRVLAIMGNFAPFIAAYECEPHARMNFTNKCSIY